MRLSSQMNPSAGSLVVAVEALMQRSCCLRPFKNLKMVKTAKLAKTAKTAKIVKMAKMAKKAKLRLLPLAQKAVNLTTL